MSKRDYYEILGVSKSASADEIKKGLPQKSHSVSTRIRTRVTNSRRKILKKLPRLMRVLSDDAESVSVTINMVMPV
jgi:preprotein translocase subunit Sec63